jgi:hypothetical protein
MRPGCSVVSGAYMRDAYLRVMPANQCTRSRTYAIVLGTCLGDRLLILDEYISDG